MLQQQQLDALRRKLVALERANYEVIQVDECLFNADSSNNKYWARVRYPHRKVSRFNNSKKVVVCGAISP